MYKLIPHAKSDVGVHSGGVQAAALGILLIGLLAATGPKWLPWIAEMLVVSEPPVTADVVIVPYAGSFLTQEGDAVMYAAQLVRDGYVPEVLVEEGTAFYGRTACEFWAPFAAEHTHIDESRFRCWGSRSGAAAEASSPLARELQIRNVKNALVVGSRVDSRRLKRALRQAAPAVQFHMLSYPSDDFEPLSWWTSRRQCKTLLRGLYHLADAPAWP